MISLSCLLSLRRHIDIQLVISLPLRQRFLAFHLLFLSFFLLEGLFLLLPLVLESNLLLFLLLLEQLLLSCLFGLDGFLLHVSLLAILGVYESGTHLFCPCEVH